MMNKTLRPWAQPEKTATSMKIREFKPEDLNIMRMWLGQDYIQKYFGDPQDWMNEIAENINADWVKYFIVECETPIGFLQYYETDKAPLCLNLTNTTQHNTRALVL